jgi:MFS family permease
MITACGLFTAAFAHQFEWQIALSGALSGVGTGFVFAALANVVVEAAPREKTGVATGINANLRTIGGAIGTAVLAMIVTSHLHPSGLPVEHGYTVGFAGLAVTAVLAGLAGFTIPARAPHQGPGGRVELPSAERVPAVG